MAYAVAAIADARPLGVRDPSFGPPRTFVGNAAFGVGALTGIGATSCAVILTTACLFSVLGGNNNLSVAAPTAIGSFAPTKPFRKLARVADLSALAWESTRSVSKLEMTLERKLAQVETAVSDPKGDRLVPRLQIASADVSALPSAAAMQLAQGDQQATPSAPAAPAEQPAKRTVSHVVAAAVAPAASAFNLFEKKLMSASSEAHSFVTASLAPTIRAFAKHGRGAEAADTSGRDDDAHLTTASLPPQPGPTKPNWLSADNHTAIYDIEAHTVYLPDGERLEAHSGIGYRLDDPHYVREKARGPTPPNVYALALRGELFHGVRAIRLSPVDDGKMYGRDGMLAHTYMLGPSGQSFGCVSFKDYQKFLQAYLRGEIDRLVVVPHLDGKAPFTVRAGREPFTHFAFSAQ